MANDPTPTEIRNQMAELAATLAAAQRPILQDVSTAMKSPETTALIAKLDDFTTQAGFSPDANVVLQARSVVTMLRNMISVVDREIIGLGPVS